MDPEAALEAAPLEPGVSPVQVQQLRMAAEVGQMLLAQNAQMKSDAETMRKQLAEAEIAATRTSEQLEKKEARNMALATAVRELEEAIGDGENKVAAEHLRMKQLKAETNEANAMAKRAYEDNDLLRTQLIQAADREKALELKVIEANSDTTEASCHAQAANQECEFLERRCSAAERRSESLKQQLSESKMQLREAIEQENSKEPSIETVMASPGVAKVLGMLTREKAQLEETVSLLREELESLRLELRGAYEISTSASNSIVEAFTPHKAINLFEEMIHSNRNTPRATPSRATPSLATPCETPNSEGRLLGGRGRISPAMAIRLHQAQESYGCSPRVSLIQQALREDTVIAAVSASPKCSPSGSPQWLERSTVHNSEPADREYFQMTLMCLNCLAAEQEQHICPTSIGDILWQELQEHEIAIHMWHQYLAKRIQLLGAQGLLEQDPEEIKARLEQLSLSPSNEPPPFHVAQLHNDFQAGWIQPTTHMGAGSIDDDEFKVAGLSSSDHNRIICSGGALRPNY